MKTIQQEGVRSKKQQINERFLSDILQTSLERQTEDLLPCHTFIQIGQQSL